MKKKEERPAAGSPCVEEVTRSAGRDGAQRREVGPGGARRRAGGRDEGGARGGADAAGGEEDRRPAARMKSAGSTSPVF